MSVRFNPGALGAQPQGNFSQLLFKGSALNFQLTTGSTSACTADVYVFGVDMT
jgi:hypothetical protein